MFESIGESTYNAFTATMTKRMTHGWQAQATYTLARGEDNAPLTGTYVVGAAMTGCLTLEPRSRPGRHPVQPDPHVLDLHGDRAAGVGGTPGAAIWNNNQFGIIVQANSGLPFNIRSNRT